MSWISDIGDAFSRPLQRTFDGFSKVFTDPLHANLGDFVSVFVPFWGGTIVSDIKHPKDLLPQAALLGGASLAANAALAGGYTGAYGVNLANSLNTAGAPVASTLAPGEGVLLAPANPLFSGPASLPAGGGVLLNPGPTYAQGALANLGVPASSGAAGGGSFIANVGSAIGAVTSGVSKVVSAASGAIAPALLLARELGNKVQSVSERLSGGRAGGGGSSGGGAVYPDGGTSIMVGSGGGNPASETAPAYEAAGLGSWPILILLGGVAVYFLFGKKK